MLQKIATHPPEASQNLSKCPLDPETPEVPMTPVSTNSSLLNCPLPPGRMLSSPCHLLLLLRQLKGVLRRHQTSPGQRWHVGSEGGYLLAGWCQLFLLSAQVLLPKVLTLPFLLSP